MRLARWSIAALLSWVLACQVAAQDEEYAENSEEMDEPMHEQEEDDHSLEDDDHGLEDDQGLEDEHGLEDDRGLEDVHGLEDDTGLNSACVCGHLDMSASRYPTMCIRARLWMFAERSGSSRLCGRLGSSDAFTRKPARYMVAEQVF